MNFKLASITAVAAVVALPVTSHAQVWDAPTFLRPGAPAGLTLALTSSDPGDALGGLAVWRTSPAPVGLGFRGGISEADNNPNDPDDDDVVGILGLDVSGSLTGPTGAGSAEFMWWTGAGMALGDVVSASIPAGLVVGWTARDEGVSFMPYVGGHLVLDFIFDAPEGRDDVDLDGAVDLGIDIGTRDGWVIRFGASLAGREAIGIGATIPR